jgi:stage II sporulation protein D
MKNKYLIIPIIILSIVALFSSFNKETTFLKENDDKSLQITLKDSETNEIKEINLEEYLIGVLAGEMPASFEIEALKAGAIAARSYALYKMNTTTTNYDVLSDITNQVYITKEDMQKRWGEDYDYYYNKIKEAVDATKDLVMTYDGEVISAYYFSMSNGYTENVESVFGESKDYLISVASPWDKDVKNFTVTTTFTKDDFCNKLEIDCSNITINEIDRSETNHVDNITVNNKTFKGTEFRSILSLRSTDFKVDINDDVTITTNGYGHGVGMSQYGANEMAKEGKTYEEILKYYYKNIELEKINV